MKVHHLNCGSFRTPGGRLFDGQGGFGHRSELVCHCLLIETPSGLVLVDTGFGERALKDPTKWLGPTRHVLGTQHLPEETAVARIRALGYRPEDVRDIVLTHLDLDHAGGLADFPHAKVHVYEREYRALTEPANFAEKTRYQAQQFAHGPQWKTYAEPGENWFGFEAVRELDGLPTEILLVPLAGHTMGHAGVAVDTGDGWLLHAGDAYFFHGQLNPLRPHCPAGLTFFQNAVQTNRKKRLENLARLQELSSTHVDEVTVFSAHSPVEFRGTLRP